MVLPFIVTAIAAAATEVSALAVSIGFAAGLSGSALATIGTVAFDVTTAAIELGGLAGVSAILSPHPNVNTAGSPQQFKPDPNAGLPVVMGRYGVGGNLVYETTSGGGNSTAAGAKGNEYLTSFVILSALGPVNAFETLRFNDTILTFDPNGQACNGGYIPYDEVQAWNPGYTHQNADGSYINNNYQDRAWQNLQLGALNAGYFPPPDKLASDNAGLPEWTTAHGFSGFCAAALTLVYDQRYYAGGVPQYQWVLQGIKIYDPRLDATYPGGAGAQRWAGQGASAAAITAARATWTFNQNPWIHALNYALGHFLPDAQTGPGRLYAGIGAGVTGVDIAAFVRAANIADANGWLICGQWTTSDGKWSVLTEMAKAGSGSIVIKNGIISCIVDTPLTSLGTVTADDLNGPITLPTGSSFTARVNTIFPRFTSEAHRWQIVQADTPVKAATYVAEDGAVRSKTLDWQYVPAVNQACQLAAYTICNGREIPGIVLQGKPKLRNYDVGDCFTLNIDEAGLATTKVMVTRRGTDPMTGGVTLTVRTETDSKHPYSLGLTGVAPATPGISGYDPTIVVAPLAANWTTGALTVADVVTGESTAVISVVGSAADNVYAQTVILRWRPVTVAGSVVTPTGGGSWTYRSFAASTGQYQLDLNAGAYDVQIAYVTVNGAYPAADEDYTDLGVETVGGSTSANAASVGTQTAAQINAGVSAGQAANASVATLNTQIADINTSIASLTATYGDTASAAASATAASASSSAAATALANTQTALTNAQAAETAAQTAAANSQTYAGNSQGYATSAQGYAATAGTYNSAAQTASVSATATAASLLPANFQAQGAYFTAAPTTYAPTSGLPAATFPAAVGEGTVAQFATPAAPGSFGSLAVLTLAASRTYQVTVTVQATVDGSNASMTGQAVPYGLALFSASNAYLGTVTLATPALTHAMGWQTFSTQVTTSALLSSYPTAVYARPVTQYGYCTASATSPSNWSNGTFQFALLALADVTSQAAAAGSATAAASSASAASASQTAAAASASSANTSATNAQTFAGNASTSASSASTSASTATTAANNASTYATNASNSATAAGGSATSASTQASNAASSATLAGNAATSATSSSNTATSAAGTATTQAGNASTSASAANSSAAAASSSASAASASAVLAASAGIGALNTSPTFANYAAATGVPNGWTDVSGGAAGSRVSGTVSAFAYQLPSTAGANAYVTSAAGLALESGWYVLEADITLTAGSLVGAGMFVSGNSESVTCIFSTDTSSGNTAYGAGTVGAVYYFRKLIQCTVSESKNLYLASAYSGLGSVAAARTITWNRCDIRVASSAEVAGNQALTVANSTSASLSSFQAAQTSTNTATATSLSTLNAAVFTGAAGSLQSQINNAAAANASALATVASQIATLQSQVTINQNLVPDGGLISSGTSWVLPPSAVYVQAGYPGLLGYKSTSASGDTMIAGSAAVEAGSTYTATANIAATVTSGTGTAQCLISLAFLNSAGAYIAGNLYSAQAAYSLSSSGPNVTLTFVAPTNAAAVRVIIYTVITGTATVTQYVSRVKVESGSLYTGWSDDASQLTLTASVTATSATVAELTGQVYSSYTLVANANGALASMQLLAASGATTVSSIIFDAASVIINNGTSQSAVFAVNNGITTINAAYINQLSVATNIIVGTGAGIKVALQAFQMTVTDGQAVTYPINLGTLPLLTFDATTLNPLSSGQTYQLSMTSPTPNGGTVSLKKVTPGTTTSRSLGSTTTVQSSGPTMQLTNSYGNAYNNNYTITGTGPGGGNSTNPFVNSAIVWFQIGGTWYQGGSINYNSTTVGSTSFTGTVTYAASGTITAVGLSYDSVHSDHTSGSITAMGPVTFLTQSGTTAVTASPNGESCNMTVWPTNGG
jgi:hypothetical protein